MKESKGWFKHKGHTLSWQANTNEINSLDVIKTPSMSIYWRWKGQHYLISSTLDKPILPNKSVIKNIIIATTDHYQYHKV